MVLERTGGKNTQISRKFKSRGEAKEEAQWVGKRYGDNACAKWYSKVRLTLNNYGTRHDLEIESLSRLRPKSITESENVGNLLAIATSNELLLT